MSLITARDEMHWTLTLRSTVCQLLETGRWYSPRTLVSSISIPVTSFKLALNTLTLFYTPIGCLKLLL